MTGLGKAGFDPQVCAAALETDALSVGHGGGVACGQYGSTEAGHVWTENCWLVG